MKKQDKEVFIIGVIIISFIVFMAILLGVLAKPGEPHFKIYKEVCEEKSEVSGWYTLKTGRSVSSLDFENNLRK